MIKAITIIIFLSLGVTFNAYAQDNNRVDQLEKEIQELKIRVSNLESLVSHPSKAQETVISGEGWKSVVSWRKLSTGMGPSDVRKILGEPHRVNGGSLATWYYQNGGRVHFTFDKVDRWEEPPQ